MHTVNGDRLKTAKIIMQYYHNNIDIQAMLLWLILPFYELCCFRSVAVNGVYKLQGFFYIYRSLTTVALTQDVLQLRSGCTKLS